MNPRFRANDRVRIVRTEDSRNSHFVGKTGRVTRVNDDGWGGISYTVTPDGDLSSVRCVEVESVPSLDDLISQAARTTVTTPMVDVAVGDRVRVVKAHYSGEQHYNGMEGVVETKEYGEVRVRMDNGRPCYTRDVLKLPIPTPDPEVKVEIDVKRAQAAKFAHDLLGKDALLEDLISLGEFVLGEYQRPAEALVGDVHVTCAATPAADLDADRSMVASDFSNSLSTVTVSLDRDRDSDVVYIFTSGGTAYLKAHEIDRLIAFLQAAKRVHAADIYPR